MLYLKHEDGGEIRVEGYAAFWNTWTSDDHGRRDLLLPGAFRSFLSRGGKSAVANWNHITGCEFASIADGSLTLWEDKYGLAFQAKVAAVPLGPGLVDYVGQGYAQCSVQFMKTVNHETTAGTEISAASIIDVCITASPKDPGTACWLSSTEPTDLPSRVQDLRRQWHVGRDACLAAKIKRLQERYGNKRAEQPKASPAVWLSPRVCVRPIAAADDAADWLIPPHGFTAEEWAAFGHREAMGRLAMARQERAHRNRGRSS